MGKATRVATVVVLCFLFGTNLYRAVTQSITHDEALTYHFYLSGPVSHIFTLYDHNHHFAATVLMRLSTGVLGFSDFSMRLPSLAVGALYFLTVYRLCLFLFGEGFLLFFSVLLLTTNPLLLDFLVAARGYGLAVSFLFYALYCLVRYSSDCRSKRSLLYHAAAGLSLAVMSNLSLLFPAFVLAAVFLLALPPQATPHKGKKRRGRPSLPTPPSRLSEAMHFVLPVLAFAIFFWVAAPVSHARMVQFYRPAASSEASQQNLVYSSFVHNEGLGGMNRLGPPLRIWVDLLATAILPAVVVAALILAFWMKPRSPVGLAMLFASGAVAGSMLLHVLGNFLLGLPYPADRTGLYLVPVVFVSLACLTKFLRGRSWPARVAAVPCFALVIFLSFQFVVQFNWSHFYVWPHEADNKQILTKLQATGAARQEPLRVGISWQLQPAFEYYRQTKSLNRLQPLSRSGFEGSYDYYVFIAQDWRNVRNSGFKPLWRGPVSGTVLAEQ